MQEDTKTEEMGFERINEVDTQEVTSEKTNDNEVNVEQFYEALKDLQEDLSNEEIIEKLSKVTKEDIEYIKTNFNNSTEENKIVLDEDSKINEKLLKLLAISGKLGEQGVIQATQILENTELGQLFAVKEFGELIVETAKFSIALSKAVGKELSQGLDNTTSEDVNSVSYGQKNNTNKDNFVSYDEYLASKTQQKTKQINANLGDNVEIKIDEVKVKIGIDYTPIKERSDNKDLSKNKNNQQQDLSR